MKKVTKKPLSIILLLCMVISCCAVATNVSAQTYTYEKEVTVDVPMDKNKWTKIIGASDTNFAMYNMTNTVSGDTYLNFKSAATAGSNASMVWVPYENDTTTLYDYKKISKIEVTGIYNTIYPMISFGIKGNDSAIFNVCLNTTAIPTNNSAREIVCSDGKTGWSSSRAYFAADPVFDFTTLKATSEIKAVFETYTATSGKTAVKGTIYNVVENVDVPMCTVTQEDANGAYLYPSVATFSTTANIELFSMKVTYKKQFDVTSQVEAITAKYPTLMALSSAADITSANAATVANEIKNFKSAYAECSSELQTILTSADVYNETKLNQYLTISNNLQNGLIAQYFDKDISTGKIIDDLWSAKGLTGTGTSVLKIADGKFAMNNPSQQIMLTKGLSKAPKSVVIKAQFADNSDVNLSAGFRFYYAQPLKDTGADNTYFWVHIPAKKSDDGKNLIAYPINGNEVRGQNMKINSTDSSGWQDCNIQYPTENAIVIGKYVEEVYTPNTMTFKIDYVLSADKSKYTLTFTISDGTNSVTQASNLFIPATATDYSLTVSGLPYDNTGAYKMVSYYGDIESIEYIMQENGFTAPTVDGVRFADVNSGNCDIAFQITSNVANAPAGYTPVAYGAYLITNQKLKNPLDIINQDYKGKEDLPALIAQKVLATGEEVPATYHVSVAESSSLLNGAGVSFKGVRFAAVGFVRYQSSNGDIVTVYSQNDSYEKAVTNGQGNRSIISVAKIIAAKEITEMNGKDGAASADVISNIQAIIDQTTATTSAQQDTLINFVCNYKSFLPQ